MFNGLSNFHEYLFYINNLGKIVIAVKFHLIRRYICYDLGGHTTTITTGVLGNRWELRSYKTLVYAHNGENRNHPFRDRYLIEINGLEYICIFYLFTDTRIAYNISP